MTFLGFITVYPITIIRQSNYSIISNIHIIHTIHNDPQCQKVISVAIPFSTYSLIALPSGE
jgi:hypothetical protein